MVKQAEIWFSSFFYLFLFAGEAGEERERSGNGAGAGRWFVGRIKRENIRIKRVTMKIIDESRGLYSGKLHGKIYYVRNGKGYVRSAPEPKDRYVPSEKQAAVNTRFQAVQRLYSFYKDVVSADVWRAAARAEGKMAPNLFFTRNHACFDGRGDLVDPSAFVFSEGVLAPPLLPEVEPLGGGRFRATWRTDGELSTAAATDRLRVGVLRVFTEDRQRYGTYWAEEADGLRGDGGGTFRVDDWSERLAPEGVTAVETRAYLLFEREDGAAWSPSRHVPIAF